MRAVAERDEARHAVTPDGARHAVTPDGPRHAVTPDGPRHAVTLDGVSLRLNGHVILHEIGFAVARGRLHALIGPNGAGKTTLLRTILGETPHTGRVLSHLGRGEPIGYVPQRLAVDPLLPLTVADLSALYLTPKRPALFGPGRRARARAAAALHATATEHLLTRPLRALSGGELRRVMLALALTPRPALLLLDEPLNDVDATSARTIMATLRRLADDGAAVLMVGHDLAGLARVVDTVTVIDRTLRYHGDAGVLDDTARLDALWRRAA